MKIAVGHHLAAALSLSVVLASPAMAGPMITVAKTSTCACCTAWVEHLEEAGFEVATEDLSTGALMRLKIESGVPREMVSCHTALIDGYFVEGHVPAEEVTRLIDERPQAAGLAVPGMPVGSPGMDFGDEEETYAIYLVRSGGAVETYATRGETERSRH